MAKELDETFPGIESINDFYTPYYMREYLSDGIKTAAGRWAELPPEERPARRLKDMRARFADIVNGNESDLFAQERIESFADDMLNALGYHALGAGEVLDLTDPVTGTIVPVSAQIADAKARPQLWVVISASEDAETGVLESPVGYDGNNPTCEECVRMLLSDFDEPARWVLVMGLHQIVLVDRRKWGDKQCLLFDLDTIFSRHQDHVYQAMAVLLHRNSLCPEDGESVLDSFDDESARNAVQVSEDLRSALRECVEILGNEVIRDWTVNKNRSIEDIDAGELTVQALRYMYRLLFLLFIEAKPALGYAPMKSAAYRTAYSLESLRDIAENMRGRMDEAGSSTYLADTLRQLDRLIFNGYPIDRKQYRSLAKEDVIEGTFLVPPLKAHIFDPERTPLIENATLRDSVMLKIIDNMSVTAVSKGNKRKQRISYASLGISQMGAVYEALLSYRGFIAKEKLYEVKRANDSYDPLSVGYFVPENQLNDYSEDERVRYPDNDPLGRGGEPRVYEPGTFVYRLAGRERETSASYYTPDNLAQCLVKYALKEIEPRIDKATDILELKICEPAMGSATFLNETIDQLAAMYLNRREKELVAEQGQHAAIPAERRQAELQKIKMYIADCNVYGIDLNPVAVELGEVSLLLNTICEGSYVPWFGTQLQCGNSLIGTRRAGYAESELTSKAKNGHWYDHAPRRIGFRQSSASTRRFYHFLVGDPGMCGYTDKIVKGIEKENLTRLKVWRKSFIAPYSKNEMQVIRALSASIDNLWRGQIEARRDLERRTRDSLSIYGFDTNNSTSSETQSGKHQQAWAGALDIDDSLYRGNNLSIREKDEMLRVSYRSEEAVNASEYARLKLAMNYWCALWFWPINKAELLPNRCEYLNEMSLILTGELPDDGFSLVPDNSQPSFADLDAGEERDDREYMTDHKVLLDELRGNAGAMGERIRLVESIAERQHFFHWELEFADVFADGGFDFMVGNPPWVNLQWSETDAISDVNPYFAVHKLSASALHKQMDELLRDTYVRTVFLHEYEAIAGAQSFYGSVVNYPLLQGQRTNLFRCFLPNAWDYTKTKTGVSAFVHPDEVYGDLSAKALRRQMYRRLRYHFHFCNRLNLFSGVDSNAKFGLHVYSSESDCISFDSIWNLYSPKTIDECYLSDGSGDIPGEKDENTHWDTRGHRRRIVHIGMLELQMFALLFGEGDTKDWDCAPLVALHSAGLISALERLANVPVTLHNFGNTITYSGMWNETNAQKDGIIKSDVHFPVEKEKCIYSPAFIGVANPYMQVARRNWKTRSDYDPVDLMTIDDDFNPRVKYSQACTEEQYSHYVQKMADGSRFDSVYRVACRRRLNLTGERTLQSAFVHPGEAWVHTITGYGVHPDLYSLLPFMNGLQSSLPYDYLTRVIGKPDLHRSTVELMPVPKTLLKHEISVRSLLLNCLTKPYAELWHSCWNESFPSMSWSKRDTRLRNERFTGLSDTWDWNTPLRTDYERRQALVELDVLASMALGLSLDELIDIYRLTFTVLKGYEDDTWYDANGRIVFSKKQYGDLMYKRPDFERIKDALAGQVFTRTIMDDTQPGGPRERTIEYVAPFDTCDRVEDYRTAWAFFEQKYGGLL